MLRYQVANATDNHVFFAGSGAAGSAELMRISGNGNVGIGTSTPTAKLEVNGTAKITSLTTTDFSATGNIGIGTTTPHAPLHFATAFAKRKIVLYEPANTNNDNEFFGFGMGPDGTLRYQVSGNSDKHVFYAGNSANASTELMRISGNGNVGIGTSAPEYKLDVNGNVKVNNIWAVSTVITKSVVSTMNESISFSSQLGQSAIERVKITAGGNVGIGTGTPGYELDVNGTTRSSSLILMGGGIGQLQVQMSAVAGVRAAAVPLTQRFGAIPR